MRIEVICLGQSYVFNEGTTDYKICSMFYSPDLGLFRIYPLSVSKSNIFDPAFTYLLDVDKHKTDKRKESYHLIQNWGKRKQVAIDDLASLLDPFVTDLDDLNSLDLTLTVVKSSFSVIHIRNHSRVLANDFSFSYPSIVPSRPGNYEGYLFLSRKHDFSDWLVVNHFSGSV